MDSILQLDPFSSEWETAKHLQDIINIFKEEFKFLGSDKFIKQTSIPNDSHIAILPVALSLQQLHTPTTVTGVTLSGVTSHKEDLNSTILQLIFPGSSTFPSSISLLESKEICLRFISRELLHVESAVPMGCETFAEKLLTRFHSLEGLRSVP